MSDGLVVLLSAWLVAHGCICELSLLTHCCSCNLYLLSLTAAPANERVAAGAGLPALYL